MFIHPRLAIVSLVSICALSACTGSDSVSSYARSGDTVIVALGGDDAPLVTRANLIAEIRDAQGAVVPIRVREVFHVYADPTSRVAAANGSAINYIGLRSAVLDLITPSSSLSNPIPVTIAPGAGLLTVRKLSGGFLTQNTRINILSGTGSINPLSEQVFGQSYVQALAPRPQVRFAVAPVSQAPGYERHLGSIEVTLRYPAAAAQGLPATSLPQAIQDVHDQHLQFITRHYQEGSYNVIKAIMVNPHGIKRTGADPVPHYEGMSDYVALRFAVAWGDTVLRTSYPPETFDRTVIANADISFSVFDTSGADATPAFQLIIR